MKQFKIRPSKCSEIMGVLKAGEITKIQHERVAELKKKEGITPIQENELKILKSRDKGLTEKQYIEFTNLQKTKRTDIQDTKYQSFILRSTPLNDDDFRYMIELSDSVKRTPAQQKELDILVAKRDAKKELGAGAKTYCENWLKEQPEFYNRREEITNKVLTSGHLREDESIRLIGRYIGDPTLTKNDKTFENNYIIGTPDVIESDIVYDAKSSWSYKTFPLFKKKLDDVYYWQGMSYMDLTGIKQFETIYCLVDLPEELLEDEIRKAKYSLDFTFEKEQELIAFHRYGDLPLNLRVKAFPIEYNHHEVNNIYKRVELCRLYIAELVKGLNLKKPQRTNHDDGNYSEMCNKSFCRCKS